MNIHPLIYSIGLVVALTVAHVMNRQLTLSHPTPTGWANMACGGLAP
jgi:hypothetical protein